VNHVNFLKNQTHTMQLKNNHSLKKAKQEHTKNSHKNEIQTQKKKF